MAELNEPPIDLGEWCADHREFYDESRPCVGCENAKAWAAENAQLIADAERRGAAQVLREIAGKDPCVTDGDEWPMCYWCEVSLEGQVGLLGGAKTHKPDCLWLRALAVVTPQGER